MVKALFKTFVKPIHIPSIVSIVKALIEASSMCQERFGGAISFSQENFFTANRLRFLEKLTSSLSAHRWLHFHRYLTPLNIIRRDDSGGYNW